MLQRWPRFRQWLSSHGIQVFHNLLAEEGQENCRQWRWDDLHDEGYPNVEQAVIAALQSRLDASDAERAELEDAAFFQTLAQQELQKPQPKFFFFRRKG